MKALTRAITAAADRIVDAAEERGLLEMKPSAVKHHGGTLGACGELLNAENRAPNLAATTCEECKKQMRAVNGFLSSATRPRKKGGRK
jgi:hypothetical protein